QALAALTRYSIRSWFVPPMHLLPSARAGGTNSMLVCRRRSDVIWSFRVSTSGNTLTTLMISACSAQLHSPSLSSGTTPKSPDLRDGSVFPPTTDFLPCLFSPALRRGSSTHSSEVRARFRRGRG